MVSLVHTRREGCSSVGTDTLCRGRTPFAASEIKAETEMQDIEGIAELYYTPLGMLVRVGVTGLEDGVFSLILGKEGELNVYLQPLYARDGEAWCTALTGKISPSQILGGEIRIVEYRGFERIDLAKGIIRSPLIPQISLAKAQ